MCIDETQTNNVEEQYLGLKFSKSKYIKPQMIKISTNHSLIEIEMSKIQINSSEFLCVPAGHENFPASSNKILFPKSSIIIKDIVIL